MNLKEYIKENKVNVYEFAVRTGVAYSNLYSYISGVCPRQGTAELIEKATNGNVTVKELRKGRDDREKKSQSA